MLNPSTYEYVCMLVRQDIEELEEQVSLGYAEQSELDFALISLEDLTK